VSSHPQSMDGPVTGVAEYPLFTVWRNE